MIAIKQIKTSKKKLEYNNSWKLENKEKQARYVKKSHAKNFVSSASSEEIKEVQTWINERLASLEKSF